MRFIDSFSHKTATLYSIASVYSSSYFNIGIYPCTLLPYINKVVGLLDQYLYFIDSWPQAILDLSGATFSLCLLHRLVRTIVLFAAALCIRPTAKRFNHNTVIYLSSRSPPLTHSICCSVNLNRRRIRSLRNNISVFLRLSKQI